MKYRSNNYWQIGSILITTLLLKGGMAKVIVVFKMEKKNTIHLVCSINYVIMNDERCANRFRFHMQRSKSLL